MADAAVCPSIKTPLFTQAAFCYKIIIEIKTKGWFILQRIMGHLRRAVTDYNMISPHDKIAVGLSGGKDSIALLVSLARSRSFLVEGGYELVAIMVDMGFEPNADHSAVISLCESLGVSLKIVPTQIGEIVFSERKEPNPCSLCSRMRRGTLVNEAQALGCNKLALGHHLDDAVETFMMSLTQEGRLNCFSPVTELEDKSLSVIRPLIYASESEIGRAVRKSGIEIVKSRCPADGQTSRERMKQKLREQEKADHGLKDRIFGAICRSGLFGWKEPSR